MTFMTVNMTYKKNIGFSHLLLSNFSGFSSLISNFLQNYFTLLYILCKKNLNEFTVMGQFWFGERN